MRISRKTLIEVGLFVAVGLAIALVSVFFIGRERSLFGKTYMLIAPFEEVSGLRHGAVVQLAGLRAGYVEAVRFPKEKQIKNLEVVLKLARDFQEQIRQDSIATIQTQGLLGDKFILISRGTQNVPALKDGERLQTEGSSGISDLAGKSKKMVDEITLTSKKFREVLDRIEGATASLDEILDGMKKGDGTIGALLKDPGLYQDMRALMGRANRSKLLKNLIRATISEQEKETKKPLKEK